jgi:hypothetical protein
VRRDLSRHRGKLSELALTESVVEEGFVGDELGAGRADDV